MNYLLVKKEQMDDQGYDYQYAERIPDGRLILPLSALKVLSNFTPEIISDDSLLELIQQQKDSGLYDDAAETPEETPSDTTESTSDEEPAEEVPALEPDEGTGADPDGIPSDTPSSETDATEEGGEA
ncbi:hypothetical protein AAE250_16360 [Bacteroides sp. GD17]|jgi:hypothetical protein|uniref:hypothetical protein n=1 Tax=Bacteroides sp. GD17 TaxID=3139826 RepID=UPI002065A168|nr:hypothetical protein [uncultured Bacteroides sp.]DAV67203.1 MAG TPA: hypothetical protein [Caudoviricetes sp.]